jgi:mannose-6-phosphate isomerase-like protein (cupin superfamily)
MSADGNRPVTGSPGALVQKSGDRELKATVFGYERPAELTKPKTIVRLCRSDLVYSTVQVLREGGENNLHAHPAQDGIWIVLRGSAKFYGKDDALLADLGPLQGIHIPRGFFYWFESTSAEPLELLQLEAIDKSVENKRLDATPRKDPREQVQHIE